MQPNIDVPLTYKALTDDGLEVLASFQTSLRWNLIPKEYSINIHPSLISIDTSRNFREIVLAHEITEADAFFSPPLKFWLELKGLFLGDSLYQKERHVNKKVYDALSKQECPETARERMTCFISEWLPLRDEKHPIQFDSVDSYVEAVMPFLMDK